MGDEQISNDFSSYLASSPLGFSFHVVHARAFHAARAILSLEIFVPFDVERKSKGGLAK